MKKSIILMLGILVMLIAAITTEAKPPRKKREARNFTCHTYDHSYPRKSWKWMKPRGKCTNRRY